MRGTYKPSAIRLALVPWPGEGSCRVDFTDEQNNEITPVSSSNRTMTFEPALGGEDARCSCETVKR